MTWNPYDPAWLIELATEQLPDEAWLPKALAECTRACWASRAYVYFVDGSHPNEPGATWQFQWNLLLEDEREGMIVLDVLTGNRIGGCEFLDRL
jgi:hypothetical protein